ncbi:hypothetical protein ACWGN5_24450 [Streptomyces sp. NPDC055815]
MSGADGVAEWSMIRPTRIPAMPETTRASENAAVGSVQDISHELLGDTFAGTDHVLRLNGPRVEAFSGVDAKLFELLTKGQAVSRHRRSRTPPTRASSAVSCYCRNDEASPVSRSGTASDWRTRSRTTCL